MKKLLEKIFSKKRSVRNFDLLEKFNLVVESFNGAEENLLTKETMLLSFQADSLKKSIDTHFGTKELNRINWKASIRKHEIEALNIKNKDLFVALENYLISSLRDYGLNLYAVKTSVVANKYQISVDFKQEFHNDELFSDLKELSQKIEELEGSLCLYKSKSAKIIWRLILSVDKDIRPKQRTYPEDKLKTLVGEV